jgi:RNA polymerase sigma-70 factor (ECF subfamily)
MEDRTALFVRLFAAHSRRIYGYVRTLVHNAADADEVYQSTCEVLWAKFGDFEMNSDFFAWSAAIARYEALAMRRRRGREAAIFSDRFYELVEEHAVQFVEQSQPRHDALAECLDKLAPRQRQLLELRYSGRASTKSIAGRLGRSTNAIYKSLHRIHELLLDCVHRRLPKTAEGRT